jgi:heptosyltransferase-2
VVINLQRFLFTGMLTVLSGAGRTVGFDKNPASRFFHDRIRHRIGMNEAVGEPWHEVGRNLSLIEPFTDDRFFHPKVYPSAEAEDHARSLAPYITVAPGSVWATKRYPADRWAEFIRHVPWDRRILLIGSAADKALCAGIEGAAGHPGILNLAGTMRLTETAAYLKHAVMNYCQDSAPLHLASAVNAPVTAIYCSTVPAFGFSPLSHRSHILETEEALPCRPCGLHGLDACPKGHFRCAQIDPRRLLSKLDG